MQISETKQLSIPHYLASRGIDVFPDGDSFVCRSPFTRDTTASFRIYPGDRGWACFSSGKHGDLIDLVRYFEGCTISEAILHIEELDLPRDTDAFINEPKKKKDFNYRHYINYNEEEVKAILKYAAGRSINSGFLPGKCTIHNSNVTLNPFTPIPAMMFLHVNEHMQICGAKFRSIGKEKQITSRGKSGFYILEAKTGHRYQIADVWLVESETSANSLWEYFKFEGKNAIIISMGGVGSVPRRLPKAFDDMRIKLIIDFDGDAELYAKRLKQYEHLKPEPVTLFLDKGQDINSLYHNKQMYTIEHLLLS